MFRKLCCLGVCLVLCLAGCSEGEPSSEVTYDESFDYVKSQLDGDIEMTEYIGSVTRDGKLFQGDTVLELSNGCSVTLESLDANVFTLQVHNGSDNYEFSIQSVQVYDGNEVVVEDIPAFPDLGDGVDNETFDEYDTAYRASYTAQAGDDLTYYSSFSGVKGDLSVFDLTVEGYCAATDESGDMEYFKLTWKCA